MRYSTSAADRRTPADAARADGARHGGEPVERAGHDVAVDQVGPVSPTGRLHRYLGNLGVQQLVAARSGAELWCCGPPGHCPPAAWTPGGLQVSHPDDPAEREAEQVADALLTGDPDPAAAPRAEGPPVGTPAVVARAAADETVTDDEAPDETFLEREPGEDVTVARSVAGRPGARGGAPLGAAIGEASRTGGRPIADPDRGFFEERLGRDLAAVRVHTDAAAAELAQRVDARAFTTGHHLFFAEGEYQPDTPAGRRLLAHELVHVVQQAPAPDRRARVARAPRRGTVTVVEPSTHLRFAVFVPADYQTIEQAYRLFERTAYGKETFSTWECQGAYCDITRIRGTTVPFKALRAKVEALTDPQVAKDRDDARKELAGRSAAERRAINAEVDRRYRDATGDTSGKIGPADEGKAQQWTDKLREVTAERTELEQLPPAVKSLVIGRSGAQPKDYQRLLRIAHKLADLTPTDLAAFTLLTVRGTDNLDLFEKAVDLFIARKAELVAAVQAQQAQQAQQPQQPQQVQQQAPEDDLQHALDARWRNLDEQGVRTMTEAQRYELAERKTAELSAAQLRFMAEHPGATLADFAKSAALLNTDETFSAIGKDLAEVADGDANSFARWAAGAGAGAKLSGWVLAVAGVLYVASWLTGIGELATIAAAAGYALGATITLSALERDLRVKAASQAADPAEFKRNVQLAAAAQANVIVSVGLIVVAAALHVVARTAFPNAVAKLRTRMLDLRERIRLVGSVHELKPGLTADVNAHRSEVVRACEAAQQQATALGRDVAALSLEEFVNRLESGNGDFLDQTKAPASQKVDYRELLTTPEGRGALAEYRTALVDSLKTDVPVTIEMIKQEYVGKIDKFLKDVEAAQNHEQLGAAVNEFEPILSEEHLKAVLSGEQDRFTQRKLAEAAAALERKAEQLRQPSSRAGDQPPGSRPAEPAQQPRATTPDDPTRVEVDEPRQPQTVVDPAGGLAAAAARGRELVRAARARGEEVVVNVGGAGARHEPQHAINVNNQAVARRGIPNLVEADGSAIGELFDPGTIDSVVGHNMAPGMIDWGRAAPGAFRILRSGGRFEYYWRGANPDAQACATALRAAGFRVVQVISDVLVTATRP